LVSGHYHSFCVEFPTKLNFPGDPTMGLNSKQSGPSKVVIWIVVGFVGLFTFVGAMVLVFGIMAYRSKGTGENAKSGTSSNKGGGVAKVEGPKQKGTNAGNIAIEIEGEDIDGKNFKLSDYQGKVVMLDFWGFW
jgi:hypothetical protein